MLYAQQPELRLRWRHPRGLFLRSRSSEGKPVVAAPGLTPKSPVMIVRPELATVEAPRTAKVWEEASGGADCAQAKLPILNIKITDTVFFLSKLLGRISLHCRRQGKARIVEPTLSFQTARMLALLNTLEADKPRVIYKGFQYLGFQATAPKSGGNGYNALRRP
jgi:hypothetical protein